MRWALALTLVLVSCKPEFAWESELGVAMAYDPELDGWMKPEEADAQGMQLLGGLAAIGWPLGHAAACFSGLIIVSHAKPMRCYENRNGVCDMGLQIWTLLHVVATACPWASTFRHEAAHWLIECVTNGADDNHEQREVWDVADAFVPCEADRE